MDEVDGLRQRYNEAGMWAVQTTPLLAEDSDVNVKYAKGETKVAYGPGRRHELKIQHEPILLTFSRDGQPHVVLNERGLFNMEHFRVKHIGKDPDEIVVQDESNPDQQTVIVKEKAFPGFLPTDEDGMWEESFGGKSDPKPKGD
jgi:alpha 1,3-glucosidase